MFHLNIILMFCALPLVTGCPKQIHPRWDIAKPKAIFSFWLKVRWMHKVTMVVRTNIPTTVYNRHLLPQSFFQLLFFFRLHTVVIAGSTAIVVPLFVV
jgi:hypothetical protein